MNIWNWVDDAVETLEAQGHDRLAELLDALPSRCCDGDHAYVDAAAPEALALARETGNPWIEVFVRHWHLQSRVLHRGQGRDALPEAISLLEFASRETTRDCPQSICAVQDLANCYGCTDGPGYAEERLAVARETLARIDPGWTCWTCISLEYIDALVDAGRNDEERAARARLREELTEAGGDAESIPLLVGEARMEMRAGKLDLAERLARRAGGPWDGAGFLLMRDVVLAEILARQGRVREALDALPEGPLVDEQADDHIGWAQAVSALADAAPEANTRGRRDRLLALAEGGAARGTIRRAIALLAIHAELSSRAGDPAAAGASLDRIDTLIPRLARDAGAQAAQAVRRAALAPSG